MNQKDEFNYKAPIGAPTKMSGKVYSRIILKTDYVRENGTCALYLLVRVNGKRKKLPLHIAIEPNRFNKKKQRIKGFTKQVKDWNILIEKALANVNDIELSFRLRDKYLDLETLISEYNNPTPNYDFLKFMEVELKRQKKYLKPGTYRQQSSTLTKLQKWKKSIPFSSINNNLIQELKLYSKNVLKNQNATISTTLKNFKKYLHVANKKGISTALQFDDIKVPASRGNRTFLEKHEVQKYYEYWKSKFISDTHKNVLSKFLFSVFTSLRISDIQSINRDNIIENFLVYNSNKTQKINKINLSKSAKLFIQEEDELFLDNYTDKHINENLKNISLLLGIKKKVTFHVARHTFATNYIINGGNVVNLQEIMDHSNIRETMIYVHIVNRIMNEEMSLLDDLLI